MDLMAMPGTRSGLEIPADGQPLPLVIGTNNTL